MPRRGGEVMDAKRGRATWVFVVGGSLVALGLAFFVSPFAAPRRTASTRSPSTRASTARRRSTRRRQPARRLRGQGRREREAEHRSRGHHRRGDHVRIGLVLFGLLVGRRSARTASGGAAAATTAGTRGGAPRPRAVRPRRQRRSTGCARSASSLAQLLFVFAVVATPREAFWAFGAVRRDPRRADRGRRAARRGSSPAPGDRVAVPRCSRCSCPFIGQGERIEVLGMSLSVAGLCGRRGTS